MHPENFDTNMKFGLTDWALALGMALTWGSSFLLIDIIIRDAPAAFVPYGYAGMAEKN